MITERQVNYNIKLYFISGNTGMFLTPLFIKHIDSKVRTTAISAIKMFGVLIYSILTYISGPIVEQTSISDFFFLEGIFTLIIILPLAFLIYNHKERKQDKITPPNIQMLTE